MNVLIFAYDENIILDDLADELNNDWLFEQILDKIDYLESVWWRWQWPNFKSLKDWNTWKGVRTCEIKSHWEWNNLIRIFYYYEHNEIILIIDYMFKNDHYNKKKETNDVNKVYQNKIRHCEEQIDKYKYNELVEGIDYITYKQFKEYDS